MRKRERERERVGLEILSVSVLPGLHSFGATRATHSYVQYGASGFHSSKTSATEGGLETTRDI